MCKRACEWCEFWTTVGLKKKIQLLKCAILGYLSLRERANEQPPRICRRRR